MLKIEQVDREAAAYCYLALEGPPYSPKDLAEAEAHQRGEYDAHEAVKAFAAHRIAAHQRGLAQGAAERAELVAEVGRLRAMMAAKPWPPTEAELRGMLADIVEAWWSKSSGNFIRQAPSNAKLSVADIKGLYAVRDALAPYVARAALSPPRVREADEQQEDAE